MVKIGGFNDRYFHQPYYPGQGSTGKPQLLCPLLTGDYPWRPYSGWKVFENDTPPDGRNVTWEAFVEYVASNTGDAVMNEHWQTQRKYSKT